MRLATFANDFWTLRSGEAMHQEHPETFWIPPSEARSQLQVGQAVKLHFDIEGADETGQISFQGERMWVLVAEIVEDRYLGILLNQPASIEPAENVYLCQGAEVPFAAEHVVAISDPPQAYVQEILSQPRSRTWPRDD